MKLAKILSLILCALMLISAFVACTGENNPEEKTSGEAVSGGDETGNDTPELSEVEQALKDLKAKDYDYKRERPNVGILVGSMNQSEYKVESGESGILLEDAVFLRNATFEDTFGVKLNVEVVPETDFRLALQNDVKSDGVYDFIINNTDNSISYAQSGLLYNFLALENLNLDKSWWDQGTRSFAIKDRLFFMNGSFNYHDDNCTYVLLFNKKLYEDHKQSIGQSFYDTVKAGDWTIDYFHTVTQGISSDEDGNDTWDENDTYGFVTTWEYGVTFFYGADLHFIVCPEDSNEDPYVDFGTTSMEKAVALLDKILRVYYVNNATYWPKGGEEQKGLKNFTEGRSLFYGEVVSYIMQCDSTMTDPFGVLPIPKYDKAQETYHSWTHGISSSMMINKKVSNPEITGALVEGFDLISEIHVRPVYYETVLYRKSVKDEESRDMLDYIFNGRVYDLAMYNNWGLKEGFKECVNNNSTALQSKIDAAKRTVEGKRGTLTKLVAAFEKLD